MQGLRWQVSKASSWGRYYSTVLAWGRNLEGQAGIEGASVVSHPTPVLELHGAPVACLAASKLTSAAVIDNGIAHPGAPVSELLTWGDGWGGKLGHGSCEAVSSPARVEALVHRAHIKGVALGDHHSLIVDHQGQVWAFGENKEGQCGLGTPLEVVAQQRQAAYSSPMQQADGGSQGLRAAHHQQHKTGLGHIWDSSWPFEHPAVSGSAASTRRGARSSLRPPRGQVQSGKGWWQQHALWSTHQHQAAAAAAGMKPQDASHVKAAQGVAHTARSQSWGGMHFAGHGHAGHTPAAALAWGGSDIAAHLSARGVQPGHQVVPARLGRDLHPLAQPDGGHSSSFFSTPGGPVGIEQEHVVQVSAGRHFSLSVDAAGQVWTFGACFNGCLGSHNTWISTAQRVDGELAATLEAEGGATSVAAGGTFCIATTTSGKAVVWGSLPQPTSMSPLSHFQSVTSSFLPRSEGRGGGDSGKVRLQAGVIQGLPPIKQVAAGEQHALLSDGERVWLLGRSLSPGGGREAMTAPWDMPLEVLRVSPGVKHLRAGAYSSAVVTQDGQLHMWGRLLDAQHAALLIRRQRDRVWPHREVDVPDDTAWDWPGHGAAAPTLVHGLSGPVRDIALGGWHALALID